ncbi:BLUF domain-containing protein [Hymenobacter antarcticus]|uniref:BLUF domain-containing protein n=1 Tax=Hymenobacter antarcticus TaxID=486270 RepID=A0ABP7Q423_9BACT
MYHLIYRSQATQPFDASQLTRLLEQARASNLHQDLTGLLLYTPDQQFLQVLEGDEQAVRTLYYEHIMHDPRHDDCFVISEGVWTHRSFPDWKMGFLTDQHTDELTKPGFLEISGLRLVLSLLASNHPGLSRLLLEFVKRYDKIG